MKGMVFTDFATAVEQTWGEDMLDDILDDCGLSGAYTSVGTYDHTQLLALVGALSARTGTPAPALVRTFAHHLLATLHSAHPRFFSRVPDLPTFLGSIETHIHEEVRKLYPESRPPELTVSQTPEGVTLVYRSHRPLADLAHGLIEASLPHFPGDWTVERRPGPDTATTFLVRRQ